MVFYACCANGSRAGESSADESHALIKGMQNKGQLSRQCMYPCSIIKSASCCCKCLLRLAYSYLRARHVMG